MNGAKFVTRLTALVFFVYGLLFTFAPLTLLEAVTGSGVSTETAVIDIRATYGGMSVAVGILLFLLSRQPQTERWGLIAVLLLMSGMAAGRIVGIIIDQNPNSLMYIYLALELLVIALSGYFLTKPNSS